MTTTVSTRQPNQSPTPSGQTRQATPPVENGMRLLAFKRGKNGEEELRINLAEMNGRSYISLSVWFADAQGKWWPTGKTVSIRMRELDEVISSFTNVANAQKGAA